MRSPVRWQRALRLGGIALYLGGLRPPGTGIYASCSCRMLRRASGPAVVGDGVLVAAEVAVGVGFYLAGVIFKSSAGRRTGTAGWGKWRWLRVTR